MFKNIIAYAVTPGWKLDPELLCRQIARPCGASEASTAGFAPPCDHSTAELVHQVAGYSLACLQTEEKLLPTSVVRDMAAARAKEIEEAEGRKVGRKEMRELREQMTDELLPRAFVQKRRTFAVLAGDYLIIDTASKSRAETVLEYLRKAADLPVKLIRTVHAPCSVMAGWVSGSDHPQFAIGDEGTLESADSARVKQLRRSMLDKSVRDLIAQGYRPTALGVTYNDRAWLVLNEDLTIKRFTLLDTIREEAMLTAEEDAERFDIDVTLETGEAIRLLDDLIEAMGGAPAQDADLVTKAAEPASKDKMAELNDRLSDLAPDAAYDEAKKIVVTEQRASISLVQRHLRIGYNHAARLIERLEADGIVSTPNAKGARDVLRAAA